MTRTLVAGWGFRADAAQSSFASCWAQVSERIGEGDWIFAVLADKTETPGWQALSDWQRRAVPQARWLLCCEADIAQVSTATRSTRIEARFNTGSVAEALALFGAARRESSGDARLLLPRVVSLDRSATLAIATSSAFLHSSETGVSS